MSQLYMQTRALEAMLATLMLACGFVLLWPGDTFSLPHYVVMRSYFPENIDGIVFVTVGALRVAALYYNGRIRQTPIARLIGCMIGAAFWLTVAVAVEAPVVDGRAAPPLILAVAVVAFIFELYSGARCGSDAAILDSFSLRKLRRPIYHA